MESNITQTKEKIFSISEYIGLINAGLKKYRAKIIGEVSEAKMNSKGHVYFTLKDEKDGSIIGCAIWKFRYDIYAIELREGLKIIVLGCPSIHSQYGFSFIAESIEVAGEGALKKEYERLKNKLTEEGIFEIGKKKSLPKYLQQIGIITSLRSGVVIADFSNNLGKFGFKVKMVDSRVEGQEAVIDLLSSVKFFKKQKIEALVIMRGGGSFEAMMAFNNESLVREISNFPVPVIAAIGHHKDMPLVALASDIAVSTPTAAAICLSESWKEAGYLLERDELKIINGLNSYINKDNLLIRQYTENIYKVGNSIIEKYKMIRNRIDISFQNFKNNLLNTDIALGNLLRRSIFGFKSLLSTTKQKGELKISFSIFQRAIADNRVKIDDCTKDSIDGFRSLLVETRQSLENSEKNISHGNPERQLSLGYSIATTGGKIIRNIENINIGVNINLKVVGGIIGSEIKNINKN